MAMHDHVFGCSSWPDHRAPARGKPRDTRPSIFFVEATASWIAGWRREAHLGPAMTVVLKAGRS
jgi:hypothetical protein